MGILQARILEWVAFPPPEDLPNPGIEPRSPALLADYLPSTTETPGKPKNLVIFKMKQNIKHLHPGAAFPPLSLHSTSSLPHRRVKHGTGDFLPVDSFFFDLFLTAGGVFFIFFFLQLLSFARACCGFLSPLKA